MPKRTPKLSTATAVGQSRFELSEACWSRVEQAYGCSLSSEARHQIIAATNEFIEFEKLERTAEPMVWTQKKIEGIEGAAAKLTNELQMPGTGDDTLLEATDCIAGKIRPSLPEGRVALRGLEKLLLELSIACGLALKEIDENDEIGFREGDSWGVWIRTLTRIAADRNLPTGVSKGSDKSTRDASPFVHLVNELQNCLPAESERHTHSLGALSGAISRARAAGQISGSRSP